MAAHRCSSRSYKSRSPGIVGENIFSTVIAASLISILLNVFNVFIVRAVALKVRRRHV
jgi:hypothetical protein